MLKRVLKMPQEGKVIRVESPDILLSKLNLLMPTAYQEIVKTD